ncbi:gfo/Idh/MocA family oxidoreductase [Caulobacter vibrioides]|uniref:Gfo/Idh/MocA family oxidoreductase n=1 Tax=Caulobacter vibrioides TaxID=155892 RepID=A0A290MR05_CAUVI|nr:Gfo/Idh/MocA family oxidoreductase [Caulobacter vibrioides]ATC32261.1 gfo/Idh/MocA family oxidoreductase [Caulobacter vibrioides]
MDPISKRTLLGAGLATGMAGLPSGASAAEPGRKLGYAILGLGYYATRIIMPRFAECEHSRLAALVSGAPEKLKTYGEQYGIPETHRYSYETFDRIIDNPDVDIVYVITPNSLHRPFTERAAKAGKHVMCEKPMANTAADCEAMIAACKKAGRKLMIGYRSRFQAHNIEAIKLVRDGALGPVRTVVTDHGFTIGDPKQWRLNGALAGGGSLMDIGIYSLNAARYLTGEEPVAVNAMESTDRADPRFREVEDIINFQLLFPSGATANCVSAYSANCNRYRVSGPKGWVEIDPATSYQGQAMRAQLGGPPASREPAPQPKNQFSAQLDHLSECILTGREPIVGGDEGLKDLRVIEAIYRAAREGRTVTL